MSRSTTALMALRIALSCGVFAGCAQTTPDSAAFAGDTAGTDTGGELADASTASDTGSDSVIITDTPITADIAADIGADSGSGTDIATDTAADTVSTDAAVAANQTVLVPEGSFARGCNTYVDKDCAEHEKPFRILELSAFVVDRYEVTVQRWTACIAGGGCGPPTKTFASHGAGFTYGHAGHEQHPVTGVTWQHATDFCKWAGGRLPTEAEWEKAARGSCKSTGATACNSAARLYPWGNMEATCQFAVLADGGDGCGKQETWPVGSKPQGETTYGAADMAGNAWEWVADWYSATHYTDATTTDPAGPKFGTERVIRGGSAFWSATYLRASHRAKESPSSAETDIGFRCVYALK